MYWNIIYSNEIIPLPNGLNIVKFLKCEGHSLQVLLMCLKNIIYSNEIFPFLTDFWKYDLSLHITPDSFIQLPHLKTGKNSL